MLLLLKEAYYINLICILAEYCEHPSSTYLSWRQSERYRDKRDDFLQCVAPKHAFQIDLSKIPTF